MNEANAGVQAPQNPTGPSTPPPTPLTGIQAVSWIENGGTVTLQQSNNFIVAFSGPVESGFVNDQTVMLLIPKPTGSSPAIETTWAQYGTAEPWNVPSLGVASGGAIASGGTCNAACVTALVPAAGSTFQGGINAQNSGTAVVRFQVHGDLIPDLNGNSIDGNHLAPYLPKRTTGDTIPGGLFESWFTVAL
jgi:hypothetical protein